MNHQNWPTRTLGDLFDIGAGKAMSPAARLGERTYPFLRTANVFWGRLDLTTLDTMNFSEQEIEMKSLRKGDLLVCEGGDIGRSAVWTGEVEKCGFQNHIHRLRPKSTETLPVFVMYYLQAGFTQLGIYEGAGNKTTIPNLSRGRLAALPVLTPPRPEQEQIAAVLWKIQRAIEVEQKLVATARELKQSAMRQLFTQGLRGEPQKETELGPTPKTRAASQLGALLEIKHGFAFQGQFFAPVGPYVLLTPGHFYEEGGFRGQKEKTKYYTGPFPPEYLLQQGDLLVAMTEQTPGLLGSAVLVPASNKYLHNQRLGLVTSLKEQALDKAFLYHFFSRPEVRARIAQTATGSKVRHTSPGRIRALPIALPPLEEQREIAKILHTIDRKISVHERKRATSSDLFQTMLHELMTAQIRVDKLNIDTTEVQA